MSELTTAAGRALLARSHRDAPTSNPALHARRELLSAILAIEAEARTLDVEALRKAIKNLNGVTSYHAESLAVEYARLRDEPSDEPMRGRGAP